MNIGDYVIVSLESNLIYCINEKIFFWKKKKKNIGLPQWGKDLQMERREGWGTPGG